jgi:hypothetical protein
LGQRLVDVRPHSPHFATGFATVDALRRDLTVWEREMTELRRALADIYWPSLSRGLLVATAIAALLTAILITIFIVAR